MPFENIKHSDDEMKNLILVLDKVMYFFWPESRLSVYDREIIEIVSNNYEKGMTKQDKIIEYEYLSKPSAFRNLTVFDYPRSFKRGLKKYFIEYRKKRDKISLKEKKNKVNQNEIEKIDKIEETIMHIHENFVNFEDEPEKNNFLCSDSCLNFLGFRPEKLNKNREGFDAGVVNWTKYIIMPKEDIPEEINNYANSPPDGL